MRTRPLVALALLAACGGDGTTKPSDFGQSASGPTEIAFLDVVGQDLSTGSISIVEGDGISRRTLVDLPGTLEFPTDWSPDGRALIFTRVEGGRYSVWVVQDDGTGVRRLSPDTEFAFEGVWIPGTQRILYGRSGGSNGTFEWRTVLSDGTDPQSFRGAIGTDMPTLAWSPDGSRIAYNRGSAPGLWISNADGTAARQISNGNDYYPRWSPDGSRIVFETSNLQTPAETRIGVVGVDGAGRRLLTSGPLDGRPIWSPDGRRIAFERRTLVSGGQRCAPYLVDVSGGAVVDLLPSRSSQYCPHAAWRSVPSAR